MTTQYSTTTKITNNFIIIESIIGSSLITDIVTRGPNEDIAMKAVVLSHKQQADVILSTDQPPMMATRQSIDILTHN